MTVFGGGNAGHRGDCKAVSHCDAVALIWGKDQGSRIGHFAARVEEKVSAW
jgi:hypothetical protein